MRCLDCGEPVDPTEVGTYREVTGFERVRRLGGANQIVLRKETGKLLCHGCGERRLLNKRKGVFPGQQRLV